MVVTNAFAEVLNQDTNTQMLFNQVLNRPHPPPPPPPQKKKKNTQKKCPDGDSEDCCSSFNKTFRPAKLIVYLARSKTRDAGTVTRFE